jgi:multidrug efflux pump subunit AcrB
MGRFSIFLFILLPPGCSLPQPMAVGAVGGLALGIVVALFLRPRLYLAFSKNGKLEQSRAVQ